MELFFATNNQNKLQEVKHLIGNKFLIKGLKELNCVEDIPETGNTLDENAFIKANYIFSKYNVNCFADDTGLEVETLDNQPGIYSARYAGEECIAENNIKKLLIELEKHPNKKARFRTVIVLIIKKEIYRFEGCVEGEIINSPRGEKGFGYDPIFVPLNHTKTFAEMEMSEKNQLSHRAKAIEKLVHFLNEWKK